MKFALNKSWGSFTLPDVVCEKLGCYCHSYDSYDKRNNPELIRALETTEIKTTTYSKIVIVEIPDGTTDWRIVDYDGRETLYYVVDGKLYSK